MSSNLHTSIGLCRLLGLFPPESRSKFLTVACRAYQMVMSVVFCIVTFSMTIQLCVSHDMKTMARTIDLWTMCWAGMYKWSYIVVHIDQFRKFHRRLDDVLAQATVACGPTAYQFTVNHQKGLRTISNLYALSGFILAIALTLGITITYPKGDRLELEFFNDPKSYPLCCWMPFIIHNYWIFAFLFIIKFLVLLSAISMFLIIDTYMFGAIYIIGSHLELLNEAVTSIGQAAINNAPQSNSSNQLLPFDNQRQIECYSSLCNCIKLHGLIIECIRNLHDMFSTSILFDYLHAVISVTFAIFQTTISNDLGETISVCFFIFISFYHQFLNNYFGDYIVQKQMDVRKSAYDFPWLYVNKKSRQLLTMMICRANRPLMITGYYMYRLCFRSLIAFVRVLYSYYMVLRNLHIEINNDVTIIE